MPPSSSSIARFCSIESGMPFAMLFSFTDPFGPPSPLAPLSEINRISVFSRCSVSSR